MYDISWGRGPYWEKLSPSSWVWPEDVGANPTFSGFTLTKGFAWNADCDFLQDGTDIILLSIFNFLLKVYNSGTRPAKKCIIEQI